jgi:RHS repeat-associated protein
VGVNDATFEYDPLGLLTAEHLPNGVTTLYSYNNLNRLTNITQQAGGTLIGSYAYDLDNAGNRKSVTELGGKSIQWTYDNLYRLTGETRKNGSSVVAQSAFTYDLTGNRLTQTVNGVTTNYTYNELDQLITAGATQYQYDGRGNLKQETNGTDVTRYNFDAANRLASVILPDNTTISNSYDPDGRRVNQAIGTQVTSYLWDETSLYGDVVYETTGSVNTSYVLAGSKLISQTQNGSTSFYLQDGQGSTRNLVDSTGNVTDSYSYTAFGEIYSQTGTTENKYLYTGQQYDSTLGVYSLRARYYNPSNGRFLSQDANSVNVNNPIELNRYVYAANNSVNLSDPSGNSAFFEYALNIYKTKGKYAAAVYTYAYATNSPIIMGALLTFAAGMEGYLLYKAIFLQDQEAMFALATGYQLTNYSYSAAVDLMSKLLGAARTKILLSIFISQRIGKSDPANNCHLCALNNWLKFRGMDPVDDYLSTPYDIQPSQSAYDAWRKILREMQMDPIEFSLQKNFSQLQSEKDLTVGDIIAWHRYGHLQTGTTPIAEVTHSGIYAGNGMVFSKIGYSGSYELLPITSPILNQYLGIKGELRFWTPK